MAANPDSLPFSQTLSGEDEDVRFSGVALGLAFL